MMRELPPLDRLLLKRDAAPILFVPAQTWHCPLCDPDDIGSVATSTVVWLGPNTDGPSGRCSTCGQKYELVKAHGDGRSEAVPSIEEQLREVKPVDMYPS